MFDINQEVFRELFIYVYRAIPQQEEVSQGLVSETRTGSFRLTLASIGW